MSQKLKRQLEDAIENKYGKIKWGSQMGYGEGLITCSVEVKGEEIKGRSHGDCTSLEAIMDLADKLGILKIEVNS